MRATLQARSPPRTRSRCLIAFSEQVRGITLADEVLVYSNTILLVQPQTGSSTYLRARLEDKGYVVVEASDATTAMNLVKGSEIALVVTELYLRLGKSRCLARLIGKSPAVRRTKLLAYTAHGKRADREWARQIGADGYVITRSGEERFFSVVDHLMVAPSLPRRMKQSFRRDRQRDTGTSNDA